MVNVPGGQRRSYPCDRKERCGRGGTVHIDGGSRGGDRPKSLLTTRIIPIMRYLIYILDHITVTRRPCDGLTILVPLIGQILSLWDGRVTVCPPKIKPGACGVWVISGFKYF